MWNASHMPAVLFSVMASALRLQSSVMVDAATVVPTVATRRQADERRSQQALAVGGRAVLLAVPSRTPGQCWWITGSSPIRAG
jgi:hypothetical protein